MGTHGYAAPEYLSTGNLSSAGLGSCVQMSVDLAAGSRNCILYDKTKLGSVLHQILPINLSKSYDWNHASLHGNSNFDTLSTLLRWLNCIIWTSFLCHGFWVQTQDHWCWCLFFLAFLYIINGFMTSQYHIRCCFHNCIFGFLVYHQQFHDMTLDVSIIVSLVLKYCDAVF